MLKTNNNTEVDIKTIVNFFDIVAKQEIFTNNNVHQNFLWSKLQFILDFLNKNKLQQIEQEKFIELLSNDKHNIFFHETSNKQSINNANFLDNIINQNPLIKSLPNVLLGTWSNYFLEKTTHKDDDKFSKKHIFSILNISIFSFILIGTFYSWKIFGAIGLSAILGFFIYRLIKKAIAKIKNNSEHKTIIKKLENTKTSDIQNQPIIKLITDLGLEPWTNDSEINNELLLFKNKSLHFLSLYSKNEKNRNHSMILDIEKMWKEHIPLFINKTKHGSMYKNIIIDTIKSMDKVLNKHIETLFWDDGIEISAKQRYWLAKETEKNI